MKNFLTFAAVVAMMGVSTSDAQARLLGRRITCGAEKCCDCAPTFQPVCCKPTIVRPCHTNVYNYQRTCAKPMCCYNGCNQGGCCPVNGCGNGCNTGCGTGCVDPNACVGGAGCGTNCVGGAGCGTSCIGGAGCGTTCIGGSGCGNGCLATCCLNNNCATCAAPCNNGCNNGCLTGAGCGTNCVGGAGCGTGCVDPNACCHTGIGCGTGCLDPNSCVGDSCCPTVNPDCCRIAELIYESQTACYARQRASAIHKLGDRYDCVCHPEIMAAFIYGLNDSDERVRAKSADEIGDQIRRNHCCCTQCVVAALTNALADCDRTVRREAEQALRLCGYDIVDGCCQKVDCCVASNIGCCNTGMGCAPAGCAPTGAPAAAPVPAATPAPAANPEVAPAPPEESKAYFPNRLQDQPARPISARRSLSNLFGMIK